MRPLYYCVALVVMASAAACSGTSGDGTIPETTEPSLPGAPGTGSGPGAQPGSGSSTPGGGSTTPPAGDGGAGDGGGGGGGGGGSDGGGGGGALCIAGSVAETEDNNTPEKANALAGVTGTYCGTLSSAADVDYAAFTLPADAKSISFGSDFSKVGVELDITVGGETFTLGEATIFKPGQRYVVKAYTTGSAPVSYRLSVQIKK
jgi:hypothetical protein